MASGQGAPEVQGAKPGERERNEYLARWLDDKDQRNLLALAIDGAFLLQGINSIKDMIASKLACGNPESITPFIDSAFSELRHMESNLKSALDARNAGQPVPEELVKDFVRGTGQLTSSASQLLTGSNREVSDNLLLELANYSSRSVASDAGLAVVQKLAEEQKTSEATREMCADHVDALLEGCFEVVQSLAAGLEKVRTLLKKHSDPEAECFAEKVEHTPQVGAMVHGLEQEMAFQPQTEAMVVSHLEEPVQAEAKAVFSLEQPQAETMTVFSLEQPQVAAMMMSSVELPQAEAMMSSAWEEPVHAEAMMMSSSLEELQLAVMEDGNEPIERVQIVETFEPSEMIVGSELAAAVSSEAAEACVAEYVDPEEVAAEVESEPDTSARDEEDHGTKPAASIQEPVERAYDVQKVFFATDRVPEEGKEGALAYSNQMQKERILETGWTHVSIPRKWKSGEARKRGEMGLQANAGDTSERAATHHIILLPRQYKKYPALPEGDIDSEFLRDLKKETEDRGGARELLLFIHGYNTAFEDAIRGAAQLAFDLASDEGGYKGAVLAYDWASYGETLRYGFLPGEELNNDRGRAKDSAGRLAKLLRKLAATFPGKKLHIVAHSMGNYCLKNALDDLVNDTEDPSGLSDFRALTRTISFAAPDVSREHFQEMVNQILPMRAAREPDAPLVTLFCSKGDMALLASSILRFVGIDFGYRAGLFRTWLVLDWHRVHPVLFPEQLDTVDASGFSTNWMGHGYFSDNESLLTEISKIINHGKSAAARLEIKPVSLAPHTDCKAYCKKWYRVIKV